MSKFASSKVGNNDSTVHFEALPRNLRRSEEVKMSFGSSLADAFFDILTYEIDSVYDKFFSYSCFVVLIIVVFISIWVKNRAVSGLPKPALLRQHGSFHLKDNLHLFNYKSKAFTVMKKIQTLSVMNAQSMTSLEIAQVTGKMHKDVMKAIRNMEPAWLKVNGRNFALVDYKDSKGELRPCYSLTKTECLYIATKFNDEARAKLVIRWQQLEQERMMQQGIRKLLITDQDVMHEAEMIIGRTLVSFNQNADGCITASDIAKAIGMEVKDLNSFLTDKKIQHWKRGQYHLTPEYEGLGLAQDRLFIYYSKDGKQKERTYLVWTQKGAEMIDNMIFNKGN